MGYAIITDSELKTLGWQLIEKKLDPEAIPHRLDVSDQVYDGNLNLICASYDRECHVDLQNQFERLLKTGNNQTAYAGLGHTVFRFQRLGENLNIQQMTSRPVDRPVAHQEFDQDGQVTKTELLWPEEKRQKLIKHSYAGSLEFQIIQDTFKHTYPLDDAHFGSFSLINHEQGLVFNHEDIHLAEHKIKTFTFTTFGTSPYGALDRFTIETSSGFLIDLKYERDYGKYGEHLKINKATDLTGQKREFNVQAQDLKKFTEQAKLIRAIVSNNTNNPEKIFRFFQ